jgi:hypothetical protein
MLSTTLALDMSLTEISLITILSGGIIFFPIQTVVSLIIFDKKHYITLGTVVSGFILFFSNILLVTVFFYLF